MTALEYIDEMLFLLKRQKSVRDEQLKDGLITSEEYHVFDITRKGEIQMLTEIKELLVRGE